MDEIFRLMTFRAPRIVQDNEVAKLEISGSNFQKILSRAIQADNAREKMIKTSRSFIDSENYVSNLSQLHIPLAIFDSRIRETHNPSLSELMRLINEISGISAEELVNEESFKQDIQNISDSVIALTILHKEDSPNYEALLNAIRLYKLLVRVATEDITLEKVGALEKALDQVVVLPGSIFPLPSSRNDEKKISEQNQEVPREMIKKEGAIAKAVYRLQNLQTAVDELQNISASDFRRVNELSIQEEAKEINEIEENIKVETPDVEETSKWILSDEAINRLSKKTKEEISRLGISFESIALPEATQVLEQEILEVQKQLYLPTMSSKVVRVGSNFYPISAFKISNIPNTLMSVATSAVDKPEVHELIGMVDLQVVKQEIKRYEEGEIAHIENVLKGEDRERVHRKLNRTEESYLTETEKTTTSERDLQSTERFELQREAKETTKEDSNFDSTVTAKYGSLPSLSVEANVKYVTKSSSEKSARSATNYTREIIEKSVGRIQERVQEQRKKVTIEEIEETNKHGIDNKDGKTEHIVGIYRWVDKIYKTQIFSYGLRTMYEFIIPEPAAFTIFAGNEAPREGITLDKPVAPMSPLTPGEMLYGTIYGIPLAMLQTAKEPLKPDAITRDNYYQWVAQYGVMGVEVPPPKYKTTEDDWKPELTGSSSPLYFSKVGKIKVPDGYKALSVSIQVMGHIFAEWSLGAKNTGYSPKWREDPEMKYKKDPVTNGLISGASGPFLFNMGFVQHFENYLKEPRVYELAHIPNVYDWRSEDLEKLGEWHQIGEIPFAIRGYTYDGITATVSVLCKCTDQEFAKWQQKTYDAIMTAYLKLKAEYEKQLAEASIQEGIVISGRNPALNRELERNELKKGAIWLLTQKYKDHFEGEGAIIEKEKLPPEIDVNKINKQAHFIQFMEQAFEWNQMTYTLYPYFWARKERWPILQQMDDTDPIHAKFLRAGAARVWVPVRPYYEGAIRHYWNTGEPWNGIDPNSVTDPAFVSVITTIKEELSNYYSEGEGTISVQKGKRDVKGEETKFTEENYLDYEIIIKGRQYRIGEVKSATHIVLRENYSGDDEKNIPYSIGAKFVGEPWDVRVPTSLVILQEDKKLPDFTTNI